MPASSLGRVALLVNGSARSGASAADELRARLRDQVEVVDVDEPGPLEVVRRLSELRGEVDQVIAAGGDGTLHYVVRALAGSDTPLAVIPRGTANDFARSLGIPDDPDEAVEIALRGRIAAVDLGSVNDIPYLNAAGVGVVEDVTEELDPGRKRLLGPLAYVQTAVRACAAAEPFDADLEIDGARSRRQVLQVLVGNSRYFGPGIEVSPGARADDGALDVCLVEASSSVEKIAAAFHLLRGNHEDAEQLEVQRARRVRVDLHETRPVYADGERVSETPADFTVRPGSLRIRVPS